jgi:DNA-binding MarR family transcriptional regulator
MVDFEKLGFLLASKHRMSILSLLGKGYKMPSEISRELSLDLSYTSQLLAGLREKGLVECLNPGSVRGRLYALTGEGREMLDRLQG